MSKKSLIWLGVGLIVLTLGFIIGNMYVKYTNRDVDLRNSATAQTSAITNLYDRMWKTLQTDAKISDKYAKDFKEIYIPLMEKRYGQQNDGSLMKWVQERNPEFDNSMYKILMNSVNALRAEFEAANNKLVSIKKEHDDLRLKIPSRFFVSGEELIIKTITSAQSKEVARTGEENDIDIFE